MACKRSLCDHQTRFRAIEANPAVFPGIGCVGAVGYDNRWINDKGIAGFYVMRNAVGRVNAAPDDHMVNQKMVAQARSPGIQRLAPLRSGVINCNRQAFARFVL